MPADVAVPDETLRRDLATAVLQRPELAAARARLQAAGYDLRAAEAAFQPQVSLFGMGDVFANRMNDMDRWGEYIAGAAISLPLFDGGERAAARRRARAEQARLTAQEQETALRVAREVTQAHEQLAAARQNVATAEAALAAAREDYRLMQLRYQAGMAVNVEVLDSLRMRTMAQTNYLQAVLERDTAEDQLRRAVGEPALAAPPAPGPDGGAATSPITPP
jgi:multidrug efflux system outer membrane protein